MKANPITMERNRGSHLSVLVSLLIFTIFQQSTSNEEKEESSLAKKTVLVVELTTSGIHTPERTQFDNKEFSEIGYQKLLERGKLQHLEKGRRIRERFSSIFGGKSFSRKNLVVFCEDRPPTQESVLYHLIGLLPPTNKSNSLSEAIKVPFSYKKQQKQNSKNTPKNGPKSPKRDKNRPKRDKYRPEILRGDVFESFKITNSSFEGIFNISVKPVKIDDIFLPYPEYNCPLMKTRVNSAKAIMNEHFKDQSDVLQPILKNFKPFQSPSNWTGSDLSSLYDYFTALHALDNSYPNETHQAAYDQLRALRALYLAQVYLSDPRNLEIFNSKKLDLILGELKSKLRIHAKIEKSGKLDQNQAIVTDLAAKEVKYMLFAGNDINLMAILKVLSLFNFKCLRDGLEDGILENEEQCASNPPPASSLLIEVYLENSDLFVELEYNGVKVVPDLCKDYGKNWQGGYSGCPLAIFVRILEGLSSHNFKSLCQPEGQEGQGESSVLSMGFVALVSFTCLQVTLWSFYWLRLALS